MNIKQIIPLAILAAAVMLSSCGNSPQQCTSTPNGIVIEKQRLLSLSFSMPSTVKMALAELSKFSTKNFDISLKFCNFIRQHDFF
ncbi:MAG: hypothetical protein IKO46_12355 [Salinivirgaceae bacterium]|nr:hypothetical protein [Salinivirgaceae bacterium]MBR6081317.1 hypothetical protein [Salinivirgaceae bacterium]